MGIGGVALRPLSQGHALLSGGSSGIARDIPASDFIESLGRFSTNPGTPTQRAGTITFGEPLWI